MAFQIHCHERNKKNLPGRETHDKPINIPDPSPKNPGYDDTEDDKRRSPDPSEKR